jgi:RHS repeat-associated protein
VKYIFFDGERVARKDFPGNTVSYYFSDHLKTASVITDSAGNIKSESDYYPWGGELHFTNNDSNHFKFSGKERDSETGLDYFGARYYSNGLGRFITPDWAAKPAAVPYAVLGDPQSLNLYTYVRNIPTSNADADGHCAIPGLCLAIDVLNSIFRDGGVKPYAKNVAIGSAKGAGSFVVNTVKMLDAGMSGNPVKMIDAVMSPGPAALQPSNATQAQASIVTQGALALGTMAIPASSAGAVVDMTAAIKAPSVIGFSSTETGMINSSLKTLSGAGYDLAPLQQLIKADMPPGCCAMSLSTPPTGAALGDGAFSSQGMLDHTLEEELLHLGQGLPNQTFGPGSAAANEAAVDAVRKIPAPPK